jgi:hypothetical protein
MKKFLSFVLLFVTFNLCSQSRDSEGFFVTHAGDTLQGVIKYKAGDPSFSFRTPDQATRVMTPDSVMSFGFGDGRLFVPERISEELQFVQLLVEGTLSLYKGPDYFYAQRDDSVLVRLQNEKKNLTVNGKVVVMDSKEYVGMLSILMKDCEEIRAELSQLKLAERPLVEVVDRYNRCVGATANIIQQDVPWKIIKVSVSAGIQNSELVFNEESGFLANIGTLDPYLSVAVGGDISVTDVRLNPRISFNAGLFFAQATYKKSFGANLSRILDISITMLSVPIGIQYELLSGTGLNIHVRAGMANHIHLQNNTSLYFEYFNGDQYVIENFEGYRNPSKISLGFWGGAMFSHSLGEKRALILDVRYERTNGVTDSAEVNDHINTIQVTAGMQFRL